MSELNYADELIENYKKKTINIKKNLGNVGIFPNRIEPTKELSFGMECMLKVIYQLRVAFLEELTFTFAFCFAKSTIENMIIELEKQEYIVSKVSRDYGKYFICTKKALYYIVTDTSIPYGECNISEVTFPKESRIILRKCLNGYFGNKVFSQLVNHFWNEYQKQKLEIKISYQKFQFIKSFVYSNRENKTSYSNIEANNFALHYLTNFDEKTGLLPSYKRFIHYMKEHSDDNLLRFAFLKDYLNRLKIDKEVLLKMTMDCFDGIINNIYSGNFQLFRGILKNIVNESDILEKEFLLSNYEEGLKILRISKNALLNTNKDSKSDEELIEITHKIEDIENLSNDFTQKIEALKEDFEVMLFDKVNINDVALFEEGIVTFDTLKSMNVYLTGCTKGAAGKYCLEFSIFQPSIEEIGISYLFKRIEAIYKFYRKALFSFDYKIQIVTYTEDQKQQIEGKLINLRKEFEALPEYGTLLLAFDEGIDVISTKNHFLERHEKFKSIEKYV